VKAYQQIFKSLTKRLAPLGFERRGSSWWQRRNGYLWQRIHIHKFSYTESFRVHAAVHVTGLEDEAVWLNGMTSHDGWFEENGVRYNFDFVEAAESLERTVNELSVFVEHCVVPWFSKWTDAKTLIESAQSPLTEEAKVYLKKRPNQSVEPTPGSVTSRA
jgi:hypothetical protein